MLLLRLLAPRAGRAPTGTLVTLALVELLESLLVSRADTTREEHKVALLVQVARHFDRVLGLLRSGCPAILENTTLVLKVGSPGEHHARAEGRQGSS